MTVLNVYQIIAISLVIALMTALFVLLRYWRIKRALETKPTGVSYHLYIWIAIKSFILVGCIHYLWKARFFDVWVLLCLVYSCFALIMFLFVLRRIKIGQCQARSGEQNE